MMFLDQSTLFAATQAEIVKSDSDALAFLKDLNSKSDEVHKPAFEAVSAKMNLVQEFWAGRMLDANRAKHINFPMAHKSSGGFMPSPVQMEAINSYFNTMQIDMNWMQFFDMVSTEGTNIELIDWFSQVSHDEYELGEPIKSTPLAKNAFSRILARRFGGASDLFRFLEKGQNNRCNLQQALNAHIQAEVNKKATQAYKALDDVAANGTTAFATSIINSVNNAADTLLNALATAGYSVGIDTPLKLLCHGSLRPAVNAAFRTIMGENGSNIMLEYNVQPVFTYNSEITAQIAGTNAGRLIMPGLKTKFVNFDSARVNVSESPDTDSRKVVYQYYFEANVPTGIKQLVNLA